MTWVDVIKLRPADTPEWMTPAWLGCLHWAIGEPSIYAAFTQDTGINWKPGLTGLERMIDTATGVEAHVIEAFIRWANEYVWGPMNASPEGGA